LDRVPDYESGCWGFESLRVHHKIMVEQFYTVRGKDVYLAEFTKGGTHLKRKVMECENAVVAQIQRGKLNASLRSDRPHDEKFKN
jgi:hypothetical protein